MAYLCPLSTTKIPLPLPSRLDAAIHLQETPANDRFLISFARRGCTSSPCKRLAEHPTALRAWVQAMSTWSEENRRAPSRHCKDAENPRRRVPSRRCSDAEAYAVDGGPSLCRNAGRCPMQCRHYRSAQMPMTSVAKVCGISPVPATYNAGALACRHIPAFKRDHCCGNIRLRPCMTMNRRPPRGSPW